MLQRAVAYFFAALFFFVPLVLWPKTYEVFEFNKMLLVYALAGTITALWATRCLLEKRFIFRRTPLDLPLALFLLSQILSTIFSINPHTSLWGYYSRFHGGLVGSLAYILLFYAFVSNLAKKDLPLTLYSILASALLVASYAIAEHFGIDKDLWVQDVQNRVFSTLGQPNWLSAYLLAILPLPIYLAFSSKSLKSRIYHLTSAAVFLTAIWFTKSQSGLATTALVISTIFLYQIGRRFKLIYLLLVPALIAAFYFKLPLLQKINPLGLPDLSQQVLRDSQTRFGGSDSMIIRQVVWQGARDLFARRPILGTGVETFGYSYYWTRPAAHNLLSEWDFLYNKAHNEYLNLLATTGAFGLSTYLLLIIAIVYLLYKTASWPLLIGFGSILVTNYFGFSVVPVALFFFLYPAYALTTANPSTAKPKHYPLDFLRSLALIIVFLLISYWAVTLARFWSADIKFNSGKRLLDAGYVGQALPNLEQAVKLSPNEPVFRSSLAEGYAQAALAVKQQFPDTYRQQRDAYAQKALREINLVLVANPWHLNFLKSKTKIELTLAEIDPAYTQTALTTLLGANELAPTDAKIIFNIGLVYLQLDQPDQAKTAFRKALELKPDYAQAQSQLDSLK